MALMSSKPELSMRWKGTEVQHGYQNFLKPWTPMSEVNNLV